MDEAVGVDELMRQWVLMVSTNQVIDDVSVFENDWKDPSSDRNDDAEFAEFADVFSVVDVFSNFAAFEDAEIEAEGNAWDDDVDTEDASEISDSVIVVLVAADDWITAADETEDKLESASTSMPPDLTFADDDDNDVDGNEEMEEWCILSMISWIDLITADGTGKSLNGCLRRE